MDYKLFSFVLFSFVLTVSCRNLGNAENATAELNVTESWRKGRSQSNLVYVNLFSCAVRYDASCFVDAAGELFETKKNELLAQADLEAFKVTGRADPENSPSHVAKTIEQLISELSGLFRDGIANFFSGKEADDEDAVVDADDKNATSSRDVGEERGKKKKKKKALVKTLIICAVVGSKLGLLLSLLQTALLLKLALLGIGILGVAVAQLVIQVKHGKQKAIYYENSHHDHHYEHEDLWHGDDHHWGRSFSQNLAYSGQKPRLNA